MKNKQLTICILLILIILISVSNVSAYKKLCLSHGQKIPSAQNPRYVCEHDLCIVCVTDNNYPTHDGYCKDLKNCNQFDSNSSGGFDTEPPVLTINSPINDKTYNLRSVLFDLKSNEPATFYYTDNINGRGSFSRLIANMLIYAKNVNFKDGFNNITIKAIDSKGNAVEIVRYFYVDSTKPKISKTEPKKGFANGEFRVWFTEENPKSLVLNYGNQLTGRKTANVELSKCTKDEKGKYFCTINVSLGEYNGQNIEYLFNLSDVAGNYVQSKIAVLKVDTAAPVINNAPIFNVSGKYVTFKLNISEANFGSVSYYDNSLLRPMWKKICSSLKNGICEKKVTFSNGYHVVDVIILDKAGNSITKRIEFDVNY